MLTLRTTRFDLLRSDLLESDLFKTLEHQLRPTKFRPAEFRPVEGQAPERVPTAEVHDGPEASMEVKAAGLFLWPTRRPQRREAFLQSNHLRMDPWLVPSRPNPGSPSSAS